MMMQSVSTYANDRYITVSQLPPTVISFIQNNFPGESIDYATIDRDVCETTYEVCLRNGVELNFDANGEWDKVDCYYNAVPAQLIPAAIANYVNSNFPGAVIVKIDKEHYGYEVELSNDLELKFSPNGMLLNIGD